MSYLDDINVLLTEVMPMNILSIRRMVHAYEYADAYSACFGSLFQTIQTQHLTVLNPPMVLFHSEEDVYKRQGCIRKTKKPLKAN